MIILYGPVSPIESSCCINPSERCSNTNRLLLCRFSTEIRLQLRRWRRQQHGQNQLQYEAADRAGEGVPLQQVSDARAPHRDRHGAHAQRDPGEDLVSEPTHEAKEADEGGFGALRAAVADCRGCSVHRKG